MTTNPGLYRQLVHGIAALEQADDGAFRLSRVPLELLPALNDRVKLRAFSPAGAELRFRQTRGETIVRLRRMPDENPVFQPPAAVLAGIFHGDFQSSWQTLEPGDTAIVIPPCCGNLAAMERARYRYHPELVRVVLPLFPEIRLVGIEGDCEAPRPGDAPVLRYLAYGSSITQGAYAPLGTGSYPAVVARLLGADPINLGFGGGAHLEPELASWIVSRRDWAFATLEMGINVLGLDPASFRARIRRFLVIFAADSLRRPVFCLDILPTGGGQDAASCAAFRRIVAEEQAALQATHVRLLDYVGGLQRLADLSDDLLHPSAYAFEDIGRHLAGQIAPFLTSGE